jgi:RND family efflux transporter MFP subunit
MDMKAFMLPPLLIALALAPVVRAAAPDIPTLRIEAQPLAHTRSAEATLEAVRQSVLAAQVPGRVVDILVDAGDRVRRGQVLMRIDASEAAAAVAGAEAGVAQAETALANARADFERARSLLERKFVSQSALDQARTRYEAAQAQLRAATAARSQAAVVQAHAEILSPLDGVVAARHVERGEMAQPGRSLLTVYDPAAMRALVDLPQQGVAELMREGDAGRWRARVELPDSQRSIDAVAVTVLPAADARTHTVQVRVDLPPGTPGLLPGSFARVHFRADGAQPRAATVLVPAAAVLRRGELTAVYVVDAQGRFMLRQIRPGQALGAQGEVEVLAGLAAGETVALDPVQAGIAARAAVPAAVAR